MSLTFKARVLLELGAELISSDAVAVYELVKNGIDAGSKKIEVHINVALQPSAWRKIHQLYNKTAWSSETFIQDLEGRLEASATEQQKGDFMSHIGSPGSLKEALDRLDEAFFKENSISVVDHGKGMTAETLKSRYLTVGTPARLHERRQRLDEGKRPPLGEKGIGRLAAMRLGHHVTVLTAAEGDSTRQELVLDWRPVFADVDLDADALDFAPRSAGTKKATESGTTIVMRDLQSDWSAEKIRALSETDFAKLADPFDDNFANQFLSFMFQGEKQRFITGFQSSILKHADATCEIEFRSGSGTDDARLQVTTNYARFKETETVLHEGAHLHSTVSYAPRGKRLVRASERLADSNEVIEGLDTLGNFSAKFYWFNRGRMMRENSELWLSSVQPFLRSWSGGLLVYRNGFRVYPYGSSADDWLDLDRKALAASAFKLNRAQIVGYLRISSASNPRLQDQTNREGFRDCPEKEALRRLLRQAIISDCKTFLERVDKENKVADEETLRDLENRIADNQRSATENLKRLKARVPDEGKTITAVLGQLAEIEDAWERAKEALSAHETEIEQYLHLAGVGLMVELIAHELARATDSALELLAKKNIAHEPRQLESLGAQLKTINKRVRVLDELSIPGRQRKAVHDIAELAELVADLYEIKAARHGVTIDVVRKGKARLHRKVEKGQVIQILDNLLNNAMYWLIRRIDRHHKPAIRIEIDPDKSALRVVDNGPGVPVTTGNRVFDAFYTTKPSGEGRGLGLYIAKRLATENGAELSLVAPVERRHNGFELVFADQ